MEPSKEIKILLFLANGFEDLEAISVLSICGWTEYRSHLEKVRVSVTGLHSKVKGRFGTIIDTDLLLDAVDPALYDALVIPGGFHDRGYDEAYSRPLQELALHMHAKGAIIATMCVGVLPLAESGLLKGKEATTYACSKSHDNFGRLQELGAIPVQKPVVMSGRIISCAGPAYSEEVVMLMLENLMDASSIQDIRLFRAGHTP